jgi:hypothetical protein
MVQGPQNGPEDQGRNQRKRRDGRSDARKSQRSKGFCDMVVELRVRCGRVVQPSCGPSTTRGTTRMVVRLLENGASPNDGYLIGL